MKGLCFISCTALVLTLIVSTGAAPSAQERVHVDCDREVMHPGDPLRVVGVSEGDNDLLEGTPTLRRSVHAPVQVDTDDLRARQLMLLEGDVSFNAPPRPAALTPAERRRARIRATYLRAPDAATDPDYGADGGPSWVGMLATAAAAAAFFVARGRLMP